jgi:hypothetical protein
VGVEVKSSGRWRIEFGGALRELLSSGIVRRGFGVYLGQAALRDGALRVLPLNAFLRGLYTGDVIG